MSQRQRIIEHILAGQLNALVTTEQGEQDLNALARPHADEQRKLTLERSVAHPHMITWPRSSGGSKKARWRTATAR